MPPSIVMGGRKEMFGCPAFDVDRIAPHATPGRPCRRFRSDDGRVRSGATVSSGRPCRATCVGRERLREPSAGAEASSPSRRPAATFPDAELPDPVTAPVPASELVEHGLARQVHHSARKRPAGLALAMRINDGASPPPVHGHVTLHGRGSSACLVPRCRDTGSSGIILARRSRRKLYESCIFWHLCRQIGNAERGVTAR